MPSFFHEPITFSEGRVISLSLRESLVLMILFTSFSIRLVIIEIIVTSNDICYNNYNCGGAKKNNHDP